MGHSESMSGKSKLRAKEKGILGTKGQATRTSLGEEGERKSGRLDAKFSQELLKAVISLSVWPILK